MQKGLVSLVIKQKTKHFQAEDPKKLLEYLDERAAQLQNSRNVIEKLLPELELKKRMAPQSTVHMYLGFKGIRTAHEHIYDKLQKGELYYYLGVPAFQPEEQHLFWKRDHVRRTKASIQCRLLFNRDTDIKILKDRNSYKGAEARYMPESIKTPAAFLIFKDTTLIVLQSPNALAVEIIDRDIADSFLAYAEEFWRTSKPLKK
ncbi:MAG TPA: hypothetical protein VJI75_01090 [Candidatus Nanoarchaeia archaeon]|nr:hypothetical protein [Candidatus Nanoarchaeia archaeon]